MTRAIFLARLAATPRTWRTREYGWIRCADGKCPILALAPMQPSWLKAAEALGLSHNDAEAIVYAADGFDHADPILRQQLLVATGLAPQPEP